jgi:membrane protein YdbS with pleckstrin-like domain
MRTEPTARIPIGILVLMAGICAYALVIARYVPELIGTWPTLAQAAVYVVLGVVWLLPLRRFLIWMETGRFTPPEKED